MNAQRYPEEFKAEAAKQIIEHGHSVADVSRRFGTAAPIQHMQKLSLGLNISNDSFRM